MNPSVCICCGQLIGKLGDRFSQNLNVCCSCLALVDDLQDSSIIESAIPHEIDPAPEKELSPSRALEKTGRA